MEKLLLEVKKRQLVGKSVKKLRTQGLVPAVIHDHGKDSVHIEGGYLEMLKAFQKAGRNHTLELNAEGQKYTVLIRDIDIDPRKHELRHIVFNAVRADEKVDAEVPVRIKLSEGNESTPAERAGLVVLNQLEAVEIEALPADLPDALYFDGEKLVAVGDQATVADLIIPKGVTIKEDAGHPVATVFEPSALAAANDAAGGSTDEATIAEEVEGAESVDGSKQEAKAEDKKE